MDLSKVEATIFKLEENGKKIEKISEAIEKFDKITNNLKIIPDQIEKNNASTAVRILDLEKKIEKNKEDIIKKFDLLSNKHLVEVESLKEDFNLINKTISDQTKKIRKNQILMISILIIIVATLVFSIFKF